MKKKLILASTSPYRKELLNKLNLPFKSIAPNVDENLFKEKIDSPQKLAEVLAFEKAHCVFEREGGYVIGSDQVLDLEGEILGKPGSFDKAKEQLTQMQGREHKLITSVCLISSDGIENFSVISTLKMRNLSSEQISRYLKFDTPYDCAGSYKMESLGISLFESIQTSDPNAIIGLPLIRLTKELNNLGWNIP